MSRTLQPSKQSLNTTRASLFHKALTRQTKPAWGNRILKDFYDLDYQIKPSEVHFRHQFKNQSQERKQKIRQNLKVSKQKAEGHAQRVMVRGKGSSQKRKRISVQVNRVNNPQRIQMNSLDETSKTLGLCPFQYRNTIQGRIQQKPAYHLSFDKNKVNRSVNLNAIFYNRHQDIDYNYPHLMKERKIMKQYHSFNSYTRRKVFQPKPELDKIYDTNQARNLATPKKQAQAVRKFQLVVSRKEKRAKESSLLDYETMDCINKIKDIQKTLPMNKQQRDIIFYPQVISASRGCYR